MLLREKIDTVDRVCRLTESQKQKLELAGRGDSKRLIDRIEKIGKQLRPVTDDAGINNERLGLAREAELLSRGSSPGVPDEGSLFVKSVAQTLTAEQLVRYEPLRAVYRVGGVVQILQIGSNEVLEVNLVGTAMTDDGLAPLSRWSELQCLYLGKTQVTDAGLAHLKNLSILQRLALDDTDVTNAGLVHLKGLSNLRWLFLRNAQVTDAGVSELQGALPGLTIRNQPVIAKTLTITIPSAANGEVGSMTVGLAKLFDGSLDGGRLRQLDRRLKDVFAIEGTFDDVLLRVGTNLNYGELMRIIDVCTRQKMADGNPVNKFSLVELGDQPAEADPALTLSVVGSARLIDMDHTRDRVEFNVSSKGEVHVGAAVIGPVQYLAKEARMARKQLQLAGKKIKPGDELPTMIVVRADQETPFALLHKFLTECRKHGFRNFTLRDMDDERESNP